MKKMNEGGMPSNEKAGYDDFISEVYDLIIAKGFEDNEALIMTASEGDQMFEEILDEYFEESLYSPGAASDVVAVLIDVYNRQYSVTESIKPKNFFRAKTVN